MAATLKADPLVWYRENDLNPPLWLREPAPLAADGAPRDLGPDELMQLRRQVLLAIAAPDKADAGDRKSA
jgi:hypothetical protein